MSVADKIVEIKKLISLICDVVPQFVPKRFTVLKYFFYLLFPRSMVKYMDRKEAVPWINFFLN